MLIGYVILIIGIVVLFLLCLLWYVNLNNSKTDALTKIEKNNKKVNFDFLFNKLSFLEKDETITKEWINLVKEHLNEIQKTMTEDFELWVNDFNKIKFTFFNYFKHKKQLKNKIFFLEKKSILLWVGFLEIHSQINEKFIKKEILMLLFKKLKKQIELIEEKMNGIEFENLIQKEEETHQIQKISSFLSDYEKKMETFQVSKIDSNFQLIEKKISNLNLKISFIKYYFDRSKKVNLKLKNIIEIVTKYNSNLSKNIDLINRELSNIKTNNNEAKRNMFLGNIDVANGYYKKINEKIYKLENLLIIEIKATKICKKNSELINEINNRFTTSSTILKMLNDANYFKNSKQRNTELMLNYSKIEKLIDNFKKNSNDVYDIKTSLKILENLFLIIELYTEHNIKISNQLFDIKNFKQNLEKINSTLSISIQNLAESESILNKYNIEIQKLFNDQIQALKNKLIAISNIKNISKLLILAFDKQIEIDDILQNTIEIRNKIKTFSVIQTYLNSMLMILNKYKNKINSSNYSFLFDEIENNIIHGHLYQSLLIGYKICKIGNIYEK